MIADAITRQLCEHYAGVWQSQGVPMTVCATEKDADKESVLMVIFDAASDPGILGYHDVSPTGKPYSKIFWQPIRDSGGSLCSTDNSLSVTISHEALELIEDPYANAWNDIGDKYGTEDAHELCDRVEGDSYKIDGVAVSNFLGPRAFRKGAGPYDYLGIQGDPRGLLSPFETRPNAYAIRRTGGPLGDTQSIFGAEYPEHRKALKLAQGSRAALRGVAAKE
jgi:hypothetical protein